MALDDRDRTFEKALARHLRPSAPSSADANSPAGPPARLSVELCPDPEMLAAYHDGALSSEERNLWKQHVLSCDRCQLVLSHLEMPLDIPVHLETGKNAETRAPLTSVPRTVSSVAIATERRPQSLRWLWLVPTGAIAATLVAWVSLQEKKPAQVVPSSPVEIAENRQAPNVAPLAKSATAAPSESRERKESDQTAATAARAVAGDSAADRDSELQELHKQLSLAQQAPDQYAAKPAHGPSLSVQKQEQQALRMTPGIARALDQKRFDAQSAPNAIGGGSAGTLAQQAPVPAIPPPPPPPLPSSEPSFLADGSLSALPKDKSPSAPALAPAPASKLAAPKAKVANVDAISAAAESVEVSGAPGSPALSGAMLRAAAVQNPHVFWAPGGKQAWRLGLAGSLEHSTDRGFNWTPQISGVYTDLLAGFASTAKVCWIVGSSGTILRTIDGGIHWIKLDSPVTNDLTGVRATDAKHAWIWFVPDLQTSLQKTYQTSDGGATWSLLSSPQ